MPEHPPPSLRERRAALDWSLTATDAAGRSALEIASDGGCPDELAETLMILMPWAVWTLQRAIRCRQWELARELVLECSPKKERNNGNQHAYVPFRTGGVNSCHRCHMGGPSSQSGPTYCKKCKLCIVCTKKPGQMQCVPIGGGGQCLAGRAKAQAEAKQKLVVARGPKVEEASSEVEIRGAGASPPRRAVLLSGKPLDGNFSVQFQGIKRPVAQKKSIQRYGATANAGSVYFEFYASSDDSCTFQYASEDSDSLNDLSCSYLDEGVWVASAWGQGNPQYRMRAIVNGTPLPWTSETEAMEAGPLQRSNTPSSNSAAAALPAATGFGGFGGFGAQPAAGGFGGFGGFGSAARGFAAATSFGGSGGAGSSKDVSSGFGGFHGFSGGSVSKDAEENDRPDHKFALVFTAEETATVQAIGVIPVRGLRAMEWTDERGRTALHWAVVKQAPTDFTRKLTELNAGAAKMMDQDGKTPEQLVSDEETRLVFTEARAATLLSQLCRRVLVLQPLCWMAGAESIGKMRSIGFFASVTRQFPSPEAAANFARRKLLVEEMLALDDQDDPAPLAVDEAEAFKKLADFGGNEVEYTAYLRRTLEIGMTVRCTEEFDGYVKQGQKGTFTQLPNGGEPPCVSACHFCAPSVVHPYFAALNVLLLVPVSLIRC